MKSELTIANLIQKIVDKKNLITPLIKKIEVIYREDIDYYVIYVSINRDDLLKEYKKLFKEAPNGYWKGKYENIIKYHLTNSSTSYDDIENFLDVNEVGELFDTIKKLFIWNNIPAAYLTFKVIILV